MYNNLIYRRQFLLTRSSIPIFPQWQHIPVAHYHLYAHPDLEVTSIIEQQKVIVLLGSIFDPYKPEDSNADILRTIHAKSDNINNLFKQIKNFAGRYALFYQNVNDAIIFNDALALREIFYCTGNNQIICGSQPNFIAAYANPEIKPRSDYDFLEFYTSHEKDSRWNSIYKWIGDETYYDGIKHVLPNHYLDIKKLEINRYWPNEPIKPLDINDAVARSCTFLQGSLKAVAHRHPIMMAVTAGTDSRTLMAASRDISDKIYYFINNQDLANKHPDIEIPKNICSSLCIPFHVHDVPNDMDDEFRRIFLNNSFFASDRILRTIYNVYFKHLSDRVNIIGIGEIGRTRYGKVPKSLNSYALVYKSGHRKGRYVVAQGEKILSELLPVSKSSGVNIMTLLYWEHTLGNWGATGNSESDIAIEEINPYDSHLLYELFLSVNDKYAKYTNPILFQEMIHRMWPELMKWPINPPYTTKDKVKKMLVKTGVFESLKQLKYKLNYIKWYLKQN